MTTTMTAGDRNMAFVLPGSWTRIPLNDMKLQQDVISALARERLGRADEHAALRQEMRRGLAHAAAAARDAGTDCLYVASEIVRGVPLPVSLTVTITDPLVALSESNTERNEQLIGNALKNFESRGWTEDQWRGVIGESAVGRSARLAETPADADTLGLTLPTSYIVNYWVTVPREERLAVFSFSTAMPALREALLELYGAIIESISWTDASDSATAMESRR